MTALTLAIPDSALSALRRSPAEFGRAMKLAAAIHWYGRGLMSQERAAELAGVPRGAIRKWRNRCAFRPTELRAYLRKNPATRQVNATGMD